MCLLRETESECNRFASYRGHKGEDDTAHTVPQNHSFASGSVLCRELCQLRPQIILPRDSSPDSCSTERWSESSGDSFTEAARSNLGKATMFSPLYAGRTYPASPELIFLLNFVDRSKSFGLKWKIMETNIWPGRWMAHLRPNPANHSVRNRPRVWGPFSHTKVERTQTRERAH